MEPTHNPSEFSWEKIPKDPGFQVPKGYFESMSVEVKPWEWKRVETEALWKIAPTYFEELPKVVQQKVGFPAVWERKIGLEKILDVDQTYFEYLPQRIQKRLSAENETSRTRVWNPWVVLRWTSVSFAAVLGLWFYVKMPSTIETKGLEQLSATDAKVYLLEHSNDGLEEWINEQSLESWDMAQLMEKQTLDKKTIESLEIVDVEDITL